MNRLADETSPYLRQHADNPVDWFPWGEDAFAAARESDRPILLSVGYSSCHWCHVMAHESFEDDAIAARMNELFVNVKVDREERPDVDAIYMDAVQALTGRGGWPMTVWLLPDGQPFFAGTYFRPEQFVSLMERIDQVWRDERGELTAQAAQLTAAVSRSAELPPGDDLPGPELIDEAVEQLRRAADREHGGFGGAPKFPQSMNLEVLLRRIQATGDTELTEIVTTTLDAMASGGMYDHLGGGFARYSVDHRWVVPHFEKMLYDQALLVRTYLHGWQVTGRTEWLQVVEETIAYVLDTLGNDEGGIGSAEDADTEGVEGKFYVWTPDEVRDVLGDDTDADAAIEWYGITDGGNFEGRSIPVRAVRGDLHRPAAIEQARSRLLDARSERVRPGLDDKVLAEWNALFLSALCEAAAATGRSDWTASATRIGTFLVERLRRDDGRWMRSWQAGRARHLATAADHAALVDALTRLAELTGRRRWIDEALSTTDALTELFHDDERGGFFTTGTDAEALITRPKDLFDGATPSATSLAAVGLARLAALTGRADLAELSRECVRLVADPLTRQPSAFGHLLSALELLHGGTTEVVVVGEVSGAVEAVQRRFEPTVVLAWGEAYESPLWEGRSPGRAHVCRDFACRLPVTDADALIRQLDDRDGHFDDT